ncbi:hypothetical protein C1W90_06925 [Burkholderia pseudomallei]|uniref:Uncharacterized protein n=1 Tax=Burkholderia pseudomallei TaxID=28450 RepID=A0AAX0UAY3_BURPE|nr:hypothetical protein BHT10_20805 [Burkholderia pseudomallei]PNW94076.1 hypothetical protein CF649_34075 [Burkholderia sp. 136(2017)]PNX10863.1 hypothetical protein CF650_33595 [Burkholderia sp. 129]PNX25080.1 hypothetical protein CF647_32625 [Burkholderia sp. 117]PNX30891.1 hypothetical protein CF648_34080 [Burkholderia sp. 137]
MKVLDDGRCGSAVTEANESRCAGGHVRPLDRCRKTRFGRGKTVTAADARTGFPDPLRSNGLHKN